MAWKKNLRKIPQRIISKMVSIKEDNLVVGCVKRITREDIEGGLYSHLHIEHERGKLIFPESIIPPESQGKHSNWNVNGREIIRKDLPLEEHYNYVDAPNYGDSYYGTHTVALPYKMYPRDFIAPRKNHINIEKFKQSAQAPYYIIKFELSEILDRNSNTFNDRLLDCLNLLQENVGDCGIAKAGTTFHDYIKTLHVAWDILPPGTIDETIERIFKGRKPTSEEKSTVTDRYNFFNSLNPQSHVFGMSGFERYFGALLREDLIVFENVKYGNAIYIMFDNWQELSQRSRVELLSGRYGMNFERIVHVGDWQKKVRRIIKNKSTN